MASIREIVAQVTDANVKSGEAAASATECVHVLQAAKASIEEARASLAAAIDGSGAQTLSDYLALVEDAGDGIDQVIPTLETVASNLAAGMEKGETFIGNALS